MNRAISIFKKILAKLLQIKKESRYITCIMPLEKSSLPVIHFVFALLFSFILNALPVLSQETNTLKEKYVVGVARSLAPYSFLDKNGIASGYSVDITNAIAQVMQMDIEIIIAPFGELRKALENGEIDAMPMYYSENRKSIVDFTSPYSTVHNAIFIHKNSPAIKTEEELRGKKIIVIDGDIMHDYVLENEITDKIITISLETDALRLLASGEYDCALMAQLPGLYWVNKLKLGNIETVGPLMVPSEICYAVAKGNSKLRNLLSEGLATIGENGEHTRIHDKWLGILIPRGVSTATVLKYIAYAVLPFLLLLVIAIAWSRILKRQVEKRTRELSDSENRFKTIVENAPVLINSFDKNGKCLLWNKQCQKTFGWTIKEINEHDFPMAMFYPDPVVCKEVMKTVTTEPDGHFKEWNPITKEGKILTIDWGNFHLPGDRVFSLGYDNTEQIEADRKVKDSEKRLNSITKNASDHIMLVDENLMILFINKTVPDLKKEDVIGKSIIDFSPVKFQKLARDKFQSVFKTGKPTTYQTEYCTAEGKTEYFDVRLSPILKDGKVDSVVSCSNNVTERIKTQQDLLNAMHHLETAQEIAEMGYYERNLSTGEGHWSKGMYRIIGFKPKEIDQTAMAVMELVHPDDREEVIKKNKEVMRAKSKFDMEFRYIKKNKDRGWIRAIGETKKNDRSQLIHRAIMQDITLSKIAEEELKKKHTELNKAKEKAEESDRLKTAFLANMSHEIRTPMNGILGFSELLKEPNLTGEKQQEYINIIEKSGDRMLNTLNDIIDISRIESGHIDITISEVNINRRLDNLYLFFKPESDKKGIQLNFKSGLPKQEAIVKSDKGKINSILTNLIKNAIKYTHDGSIEFGCNLKMEGGISELEFYIKDTGIGIPKDRQQAIFNRFEQADIEDKEVYEGSGLGLAISKAYVEMLGGKIWVESEEGVGSKFYFTIPYNTNNKEITRNEIESTAKQIPKIKMLKILLADDEEFAIDFFYAVLNKYEKEMLVAKTGAKAVELCRNNPDIDLILMDIRMSEMNGHEATRQIRKFNKDVIIIAQTANVLRGDREKAIEAGCNDYISKPIKKDILFELITKYFS